MSVAKSRLSVWELFLGEISRNITPTKAAVERQLEFLLDRKACSKEQYNALVAVRFMASYEQAINEYLHPPIDFKQANIKAELIHFGSVFEGLLEVFLASLFKKNEITLTNYNMWFSKNNAKGLMVREGRLSKELRNGRLQPLSFKGSIDCLTQWNKHKNNEDVQVMGFAKLMDMLRVERNNVHVNHMVSNSILHEEHKLVEVREKWDGYIDVIKNKI